MHGIADYEFLRPIGAGGNGQVFLARRPRDPSVVAVKVFARESTSDILRSAAARLHAKLAVEPR